MGIIAALICIIFLLICLKSAKGGLANPFVLYFSLWSVVLCFSVISLFGMYVPSDKTYILITLMNAFFFLGGTVKLPKKIGIKAKSGEVALNVRLVYLLLVISFVVKFVDFISALQKLQSGMELWEIRQDAFAVYDASNGSFFAEVIKNVLISPFNSIVIPLSVYLLFRETNRSATKILVAYLVASTLMGAVSDGGGRLNYIYIAGCAIYSFWFLDKKKIGAIYSRYKHKINIALILMGTFIIVLTIIRVGIDNLFEQIYTYFGMTPTLLDVNLKVAEGYGYTFGLLTLFGFHSYFFRFLNVVGLPGFVPLAYDRAYQYLLSANVFRNVGFGSANSFVSPIYYFYLDGGYAAVILFSFCFGVLVSNATKMIRGNLNAQTFCYYSIMMYGVFLSFIRIQTTIPSFCISLFMVPLLFKKIKSRN